MKKFFMLLVAFLMVFSTANAEEQTINPLKDESIKVHIAETFSDRADGVIVWDDAASGFWTGSIFFQWPEAEWKNGQLVMTEFPGLEDSRMTFRIQTNEMPQADINGSVGIGFYIENNTAVEQNVGFYMIGSSSCLKNKNGTTLLFVNLDGSVTASEVTDNSMAIIPPGAKGYVLGYYEDFQNLWSSEPYSPEVDKIAMPGFELTYLLIDGEKGESVVIDNVFFFGEGCADNNQQQLISRTFAEPTLPAPNETQTVTESETVTEQPQETATIADGVCQDNSTIVYILSCAIFLTSLVAAFLIVRKK